VSKHSILVNVVTFILDITLADRLEVAGIIALFSQMLNQAAYNGCLAAVLAGRTNIKWFHRGIYIQTLDILQAQEGFRRLKVVYI
jgi:hypothetical protein